MGKKTTVMKKDKAKLKQLLNSIEQIIESVLKAEKDYSAYLDKIHEKNLDSAQNLIYYRNMRSKDLSKIQKQLGRLGLSRFAKAQSHVLSSLYVNRSILSSLINRDKITMEQADFSFALGQNKVRKNAKALLGEANKGRRTRIMVTLPSEAADNYILVERMLMAGMNCARINCAHDHPEAWHKMAAHVRKAAEKLNRPCQVAMDLGGPKIRTGPLAMGPMIKKYRPAKNERGEIVTPLQVCLSPLPPKEKYLAYIPIRAEDLSLIKSGDTLYFRDTRNKKRKISIITISEQEAIGLLYRTAYLEADMRLYLDKKRKNNFIRVCSLPAIEAPIVLQNEDTLILHKDKRAGESATYDERDQVLSPAHISCTSDEVFNQVKVGEPILFDDGQIRGEITEVQQDALSIRIVHTMEGGGKLRSDKGINLPNSKLTIRGLTEKDKEDLPYVVEYADIVNLSFVNSAKDVEDLIDALDTLGARDKMKVILKIETQAGFNNLVEILLTAMQMQSIGVMIARGDLAIETGWENIGRIQKEILSLCQAAHVPDIWATQVLENLAKRGIPSRAEITDAVMAQRAECVMLNKGGYILHAIHLLDSILRDMDSYQDKNASLLPAIKMAGG
jgi:pyruvate kinase